MHFLSETSFRFFLHLSKYTDLFLVLSQRREVHVQFRWKLKFVDKLGNDSQYHVCRRAVRNK